MIIKAFALGFTAFFYFNLLLATLVRLSVINFFTINNHIYTFIDVPDAPAAFMLVNLALGWYLVYRRYGR